ncbi:MAG: DnaA N-terminal domain-containing protein [Paracoccaceae bacterium]
MPQTGKSLSGLGAGAQKYDVLTALGTFALAADRSTQRRVLRLITLITARYNWRLRELTVGRKEIARLWSVDERTVKREIGALKALGFLEVKRPGARGRVTAYAVNLNQIMAASQADWTRVGPDFAERMTAMTGQGADPENLERKVIPFPPADHDEGSEWSKARALLKHADKARFAAWFAPLSREALTDDLLILRAPSAFHAEYVETHLLGEAIRAIAVTSGRNLSVRIVS